MIIRAPVHLTRMEQEHIDGYVLTPMLPWYSNDKQTTSSNCPHWLSVSNSHFLSHVLLARAQGPEDQGEIMDYELYKFFLNIFRRWCGENNVSFTYIYRACLNFTVSARGEFTMPHVDHPWPHNNWVMYLNTVPGTDTVFFDDAYQLADSSACVANTAVAFPGQLHAVRNTPGEYRRFCCVLTYY